MNNKKPTNGRLSVLEYLASLDEEVELQSWIYLWKELIDFPSTFLEDVTEEEMVGCTLYTLIGIYTRDENIKIGCTYTKGPQLKRFTIGFWRIPDGNHHFPFNVQFIKHHFPTGEIKEYVLLTKYENNFLPVELQGTDDPRFLPNLPIELRDPFIKLRAEFRNRFHWK